MLLKFVHPVTNKGLADEKTHGGLIHQSERLHCLQRWISIKEPRRNRSHTILSKVSAVAVRRPPESDSEPRRYCAQSLAVPQHIRRQCRKQQKKVTSMGKLTHK